MGIGLVSSLLEIRELSLSRGARLILRGVTLTIERGEVCALMGLSGCGKTTALRAAVALEAFDFGSVEVGGFRLSPGPVPAESRLSGLRRRVGMVFQAHALFEHLTAEQNVALAPRQVLRTPRGEAETRARALLGSLGIGTRAGAYPRELSGGEAQRVAIARSLAMDPPLLLMDEPTAALDPARRGSLGETLRRLAAEGRGLLIATHDVDFARDFADRVAVLAEGVVVEVGEARAVLERPAQPATRELLAARPKAHEGPAAETR
jgi:ABC-type polar amino acid transport system ATPase subunit